MRLECSPAHQRSLRNLVPQVQLYGIRDVQVAGLSTQAAECRPGDVFAVASSTADAVEQALIAWQAGAAIILSDQPLAVREAPVAWIAELPAAVSRIAHALCGQPSQHLELIGAAGSVDPEPAAKLLENVFLAAEIPACTLPLVGASATDVLREAVQLALDLQARAISGAAVAIVPVADTELAAQLLSPLTFDHWMLTSEPANFGINSRENKLGGLTSPARLKAGVPGMHLAQLAPAGMAVFNADDVASSAAIRQFEGPALTIGVEADADICGQLVSEFFGEQTCLITAGTESIAVRTQLLGSAHLYACLYATAVGLAHEIPLTTIATGLEQVGAIRGRLERVSPTTSLRVFLEAAPSGLALEQAISTLRRLTPGRLVCVLGLGEEGFSLSLAANQQVLASQVDQWVLTAAGRQRTLDPRAVAKLWAGCKQPGMPRVISDRTSAIHWALGQARPEDTVLIVAPATGVRGPALWMEQQDDDRFTVRDWFAHEAVAFA